MVIVIIIIATGASTSPPTLTHWAWHSNSCPTSQYILLLLLILCCYQQFLNFFALTQMDFSMGAWSLLYDIEYERTASMSVSSAQNKFCVFDTSMFVVLSYSLSYKPKAPMDFSFPCQGHLTLVGVRAMLCYFVSISTNLNEATSKFDFGMINKI